MIQIASLQGLLADLVPVSAALDRPVTGLSSDSRHVHKGDLFLAVRGARHHGLEFLPAVRQAGATAVVWEPPFSGDVGVIGAELPMFAVENLSRKLGLIAERFYGALTRDLELIGVTGTNGKTSCTHFIAESLMASAKPCGLIGTLGNGLFGCLESSGLTTPDALALWHCLAKLRAQGARFIAMEVSSHALAQNRVGGLAFAVAVLTNLSRDHLDYHVDMAAYRTAKRQLFTVHQPRYAVLNLDDTFGRELAADLAAQTTIIGYGLGERPAIDVQALVWGDSLALSATGLTLHVRSSWGEGVLHSRLLGRFNAANLLATLATLLALEMPFSEALERLSNVASVTGRMECFGGAGKPLVVVDYAHTPDALEQVLVALREHARGHLYCVFGCGGDRDPGKRPQMGAIAEIYADRVVLTNDNPRSENPQRIVSDILAGMRHPECVEVECARDQAINRTLARARANDIVLIAGKGHEDYQLVGSKRLAFSDRDAVQRCLEMA